MTTISPAKYVRVNHISPGNNIWFYEMTDGKWTIQFGSESNTVMTSKIVESPAEDLLRFRYTYAPQFDDVWFCLTEPCGIDRAIGRIDNGPAELGRVLLRSGKKTTRLLDFTGLCKRAVIARIRDFYEHKTYRKALAIHGSCFRGFMIDTRNDLIPTMILADE